MVSMGELKAIAIKIVYFVHTYSYLSRIQSIE